MTYYSLAVDIGASSGRLTLGYIEKNKLQLLEVHRFDNQMIKKNNHFCWNIENIFHEIKKGIQKCHNTGVQPDSIGIDTWAVDFVLLDENDDLLTDVVAYRDQRTDGMIEEVSKLIPKETLYYKTGIQFQKFNTINQLYSIKKTSPDILEKAKTFLMIPDYLNFLLTNIKSNEYTNATSTQLVTAETKQWDNELLHILGINRDMFQDINMPKTLLGGLKEEFITEFGFDMKVILPATHDTGSAVISVPENQDTIYISTGTWSLIGIENLSPNCEIKALKGNFTNEGGIDYRYRFLKNIMGLWMIQEVKRNLDDVYTFGEFVKLAREATDFHSIVDVNEDRFLKPENMIIEIQKCCAENNQPIPYTPGEIAKCIFESLAVSYKNAIEEIEDIFDKQFDRISVIGGGCQNEMLNQLIADTTNKEVNAGPIEATTIGNIAAQLMAVGELSNLREVRPLIKNSFEIKTYVSTKSN